jgi:hypothetical protein
MGGIFGGKKDSPTVQSAFTPPENTVNNAATASKDMNAQRVGTVFGGSDPALKQAATLAKKYLLGQ